MSIYDSIGGAPAVTAAVGDFYVRVTGDPNLAPYFDATPMGRLKSHQRAFIAAALGGPQLYAGRDMAAAHAELAVSDADFDAVVGHLVATFTSLEIPAETIGQIGACLAPLREQIVTRDVGGAP